ncbi:bacterio-opsin activator domain-containing protein [Halomicrococcus sp. NG-SE-24]|uniref:helix-turn-helix domain-containing protein n=1 Tax=Halomicrococcus sp. NG-SE-24 TaxID=3436928 RepID=UPI003D98B802
MSKPTSAPVLEFEFTITDAEYPFIAASKAEKCQFDLLEMIPRSEGEYAEFFTVKGADPHRILELAATHETVTAQLLREADQEGLFEFNVSDNCPAVALAELGALPRTVRSVNGEGHIVAEFPSLSNDDPAVIVDTFLTQYPEAELITKRNKDHSTPLFNDWAFKQILHEQLTDRQQMVLQTAFEAGYYEWPRECTGQEVAEELGISSATFSQHIHAAERKVLSTLFE